MVRDTEVLKERTDVQYALLRDISLKDITALPEDATGAAAHGRSTIRLPGKQKVRRIQTGRSRAHEHLRQSCAKAFANPMKDRLGFSR